MTPTRAARPRDASRTRRDLLDAARLHFGQQGYDRTTLRDIADAAGVDPALIARYFGSKAALYVASLEEVEPGLEPDRPGPEDFVERLIERTSRLGPSPLLQAAVRPADDPEVGGAARRILARRHVAPLIERAAAAGLDAPELRAELAAAALAGIALARVAGTFDRLAEAGHDDVVRLTLELIAGIAGPGAAGRDGAGEGGPSRS